MTLREHLEAIRDEAQGRADDHSKHPLWDGCQSCQKFYPCTDRIGAYVIRDATVAALAILDAADTETWDEDSPASPVCTPQRYRLVRDPEPS